MPLLLRVLASSGKAFWKDQQSPSEVDQWQQQNAAPASQTDRDNLRASLTDVVTADLCNKEAAGWLV
jgi:hypothetical protein